MPTPAIWSLVVSLLVLSLGLTYKIVELSRNLKLSDKDCDSLRSKLSASEERRDKESVSVRMEINSLKETHDKEISDINKFNETEVKKLIERISELELAPWQVKHKGPINKDDL